MGRTKWNSREWCGVVKQRRRRDGDEAPESEEAEVVRDVDHGSKAILEGSSFLVRRLDPWC